MSARSFARTLAAGDGFCVLAEVAPGRDGADRARTARALAAADALAIDRRITALSITDGAGGHAALAAEALAGHFADGGRELVVNVACRGRSREELLRIGASLAGRGLTNVLVISGDLPAERGDAEAPAKFDLDSAALLALYAGLDATRSLNAGAVVNAHKRFEREQVPQYHKLELKIASGARFIVGQLGYDARKDDELLRYLRLRRLTTPALASIYMLDRGTARHFHAGRVPGCVVTDALLERVEREALATDHGRRFFVDLAARQVAIARGLGYRGVLIGGYRSADELIEVLDLADSFAADDWRVFARQLCYAWHDTFYYFDPDAATGLNSDAVNAAYLESCAPDARRRARGQLPARYRLSRLAHETIFAPEAPAFPLGAALFRGAERTGLGRSLHVLEQAIKEPLFDCRDCGDCSLAETAYLCPESQCPKGERNGPCGGSRDGRCEVDDRPCVWALAYDRLKPYGEEDAFAARTPTIADPALRRTSAWANTFLERDHLARHGRRLETR